MEQRPESAPHDVHPALRQALFVIEKLEGALGALREDIAVVGMGCRFPGAADPDALWRVLLDGVDAITETPATRWDVDAFYDPDPAAVGRLPTRNGGFLQDVDRFDPLFFGISPREAPRVDPQQRLLLEVAWEALEHAGCPPRSLRGSRTGVFVGIAENDFARVIDEAAAGTEFDHYDATGSGFCFASGRLSHVLGLRGPNVAVDTACSSSLVAIHQAISALRLDECDRALTGGVHLRLAPAASLALARSGALSPDGRCKPFDASADGFGRSEGCGIVVLRRLADAQRDGDRVLAVMRGSAVNHDGPASGFTVPDERAQVELIRAALANARLDPAAVGFIEAHGTGTQLGDPIEVGALAEVFEGVGHEIALGSIKSNLGHTEGAAGVAGVIKAVLALQHGAIPPNVHFRSPTPHIPWDQIPFVVPTHPRPWPETGGRRIAAVSSFGMSGTNAHVLLEEAPAPIPPADAPERHRPLHVLALSARDDEALDELAGRYANVLRRTDGPADVCFTANTGRSAFDHRLYAIGADGPALAAALASGDVVRRTATDRGGPPVGFLFTGQGSQYGGMGRVLLETEPVFADALERLAAVADAELERPLLPVLLSGDGLDETAYTQPALLALELALAELWSAWGVRPAAVLGHSVGEYAAACVAGVLSSEDAMRLVCARGRLMQDLPRTGGMLAVEAAEPDVAEVIAPFDRLAIAATNGPTAVVVSGDAEQLAQAGEILGASGCRTRALDVSHAFHSPLVDPVLAPFTDALAGVLLRPPDIPLVSNVTGTVGDAALFTDPAYWVEHVRRTVRFAQGARALHAAGVRAFLEVGPRPALLPGAQAAVTDEAVLWLPTLREGRDWQELLRSLAELHIAGVPVDWRAFDRGRARRIVDAPTYPFRRRRYWPASVGGRRTSQSSPVGSAVRSLVHRATLVDLRLDADEQTFVADHRIGNDTVVSAAVQLAAVVAAVSSRSGSDDVELTDVVFSQPLRLAHGERRSVQLVLHDDGGFELASGEPARVHAAGRARIAMGSVARATDPEALCARLGSPSPGVALYDRLEQQGISIGPALRWVQDVRDGGNEALAALAQPTTDGGFGAVAGVIDACLQATEVGADGGEARLPFRVGRVRWAPAIATQARWAHARRTQDGQWDIHALAADGSLVAEFIGFEDRPLAVAAAGWQGLLAELRWEGVDAAAGAPARGGRWLVLHDSKRIGGTIVQALEARGVKCEAASLDSVLAPGRLDAHDAVLIATEPDAGPVPDRTESLTASLLDIVQTLGRAPRPPRLALLTRHARSVRSNERADAAQAALWGMARAVAAEYTDLAPVCVDVDAAGDAAAAALIAGAARDGTRFLAVRDGRTYAERPASTAEPPPPAAHRRLHLARAGSTDGVTLTAHAPKPPRHGEVQIEVRAAGLNFRDVLIALGMLGDTPSPDAPLGFECAGVVAAVGPGVTALNPGDPVMAMAEGSFATSVCVAARAVAPLPAALGFAEGSTIPLAFLTAHHALVDLADLRAGERVLIHAAAGGVGQAAIQLARRCGAQVLATASPEKHDVVRASGVSDVMNSRTPDFAAEVLRLTGGAGVDVVLNCLTGDLVAAGVAALGRGGRFVELGRRDVWDRGRMAAERPDVRYHAFDLGEEDERDPTLLPRLFSELGRGFAAGELVPLPATTFPADRAADAYDCMKRARHVGKLVVAFGPAAARPRRDASYLVTGGTGALGLRVAERLAAEGAGHVVLASRRGQAPADAVTSIEKAGASVAVVNADVSDPAGARRALAACRAHAPLRGIVHAAGVLDDGVLAAQSASRVRDVLAPKVRGAWELQRQTLADALDFFVMFSSVAAVEERAGQGAYAAANAALDALAGARRATGLPALSIGWGPWADAGMAARTPSLAGVPAIAPRDALDALVGLLGADTAHLLVLPHAPATFERAAGDAMPADVRSPWRERVAAAPASERADVVAACVRARVAQVIGLAEDTSLDERLPFADLGMDSLMLVELRNALQSDLGVALPAAVAFDHASVERLSDRIGEAVASLEPEPELAADPRSAVEPNALRALLDAELELLAEEDARP